MIRNRFGLRDKRTHQREDLSIAIEEIQRGEIPRHVAIIMDGNGRWAKKRRQPRIAGHRAGAKAIRQVVEIAGDVGVDYVTLYAFSTENWSRPKEEVSGLMQLFEEQLTKELDELDAKGARIRVIGRLHEIPQSTQDVFARAIERTKNNTKLNLIIALNYSGRAELLDAMNSICRESRESGEQPEINEDTISRHLYAPDVPDPELLIRTSGELRLSNFLLWQIAYTELWITDKFWPDFSKSDFVQAIADYQRRTRRFGGIGDD